MQIHSTTYNLITVFVMPVVKLAKMNIIYYSTAKNIEIYVFNFLDFFFLYPRIVRKLRYNMFYILAANAV